MPPPEQAAQAALSSEPVELLDVQTTIVGCGMSGLLLALKLRARGLDCLVFDKAGALGGTWQANVYLGCACDVPSTAVSRRARARARGGLAAGTALT
jgi:glycine/D-amino acid oxidase-like deaminating enzyme